MCLPTKSYRIAPPKGWKVIPGSEGRVEFRSLLADRGYWPGMMLLREPAQGFQDIGPKEAGEINALVAEDREAFRFVSGELLDLPFGKAYLVTYEHIFEELRMKTAEAHFVRIGVRYFVPFNTLAETFSKHFPAYLNCLRTFAPLDPENGQVCN